jgi:hypothetical protein
VILKLVIKTGLIVGIAVLVYASLVPASSLAHNKDHTYTIYVPRGEVWEKHALHVSTPISLYDYYRGKNHAFDAPAKFVTPNAFQPVADDVWSVCEEPSSGAEAFVNAVLMLVHQIPYQSSAVRYAVETLVIDEGDCDTLAYLAASILRAGGVDVVLVEYPDQKHTNLGVQLSYPPMYSLSKSAVYYQYDGKRYYMAECTSRGVDVQDDWRVGECPKELTGSRAQIISLRNCEAVAPATVSSYIDTPLATSSITISASSDMIHVGDTVEICGTASPHASDRRVVIYLSSSRFYWSVLKTLQTDASGSYLYQWRPSLHGPCYLRASVSGGEEYTVADSDTYTLTVLTQSNAINHLITMGFTFMAAVSILVGFSTIEIVKTIREFL